MLKKLCCLTFVVAPVSSSGLADGMPDPMWQDSWKCGEEISLDRDLVTLATAGRQQISYAGNSTTPPFFTAEQPMWGGSLLFVKNPSGWAGYPLGEAAGTDSVYQAPGGRTVMFVQVNVEGPGPFSAVSTTNGFKSISCTNLDVDVSFPKNPSIESFGGDETGKTEALFTVDDEGIEKRFMITSTNFGKDWSSAVETSVTSVQRGIWAEASTSEEDLPRDLFGSLPN